ncbi:MAG: hypothetical protein KVP17_001396 [Porospora cf. gigantea B]|uniref:uncharacterized protein n=1 Tax=Porospora cf. gigantea B TaxID=2853592 RepID=UPI003571C0A9|nr:MAG: hypothetical protein KVP17_001396 [Porospora cf. gigantea B]
MWIFTLVFFTESLALNMPLLELRRFLNGVGTPSGLNKIPISVAGSGGYMAQAEALCISSQASPGAHAFCSAALTKARPAVLDKALLSLLRATAHVNCGSDPFFSVLAAQQLHGAEGSDDIVAQATESLGRSLTSCGDLGSAAALAILTNQPSIAQARFTGAKTAGVTFLMVDETGRWDFQGQALLGYLHLLGHMPAARERVICGAASALYLAPLVTEPADLAALVLIWEVAAHISDSKQVLEGDMSIDFRSLLTGTLVPSSSKDVPPEGAGPAPAAPVFRRAARLAAEKIQWRGGPVTGALLALAQTYYSDGPQLVTPAERGGYAFYTKQSMGSDLKPAVTLMHSGDLHLTHTAFSVDSEAKGVTGVSWRGLPDHVTAVGLVPINAQWGATSLSNAQNRTGLQISPLRRLPGNVRVVFEWIYKDEFAVTEGITVTNTQIVYNAQLDYYSGAQHIRFPVLQQSAGIESEVEVSPKAVAVNYRGVRWTYRCPNAKTVEVTGTAVTQDSAVYQIAECRFEPETVMDMFIDFSEGKGSRMRLVPASLILTALFLLVAILKRRSHIELRKTGDSSPSGVKRDLV